MSVFIKCGRINKMWAYQTAGRGEGVRESTVKWSGKINFGQGKVSEKSGNFISD